MNGLPDPGWLAAAAIATPLAGAVGILLARRRPNVREGVSLASGIVLFCVVALAAAALEAGERIRLTLAEPLTGLR